MADARQKEMKASITVLATTTLRGPGRSELGGNLVPFIKKVQAAHKEVVNEA
jgi:hypothetical protein